MSLYDRLAEGFSGDQSFSFPLEGNKGLVRVRRTSGEPSDGGLSAGPYWHVEVEGRVWSGSQRPQPGQVRLAVSLHVLGDVVRVRVSDGLAVRRPRLRFPASIKVITGWDTGCTRLKKNNCKAN